MSLESQRPIMETDADPGLAEQASQPKKPTRRRKTSGSENETGMKPARRPRAPAVDDLEYIRSLRGRSSTDIDKAYGGDEVNESNSSEFKQKRVDFQRLPGYKNGSNGRNKKTEAPKNGDIPPGISTQVNEIATGKEEKSDSANASTGSSRPPWPVKEGSNITAETPRRVVEEPPKVPEDDAEPEVSLYGNASRTYGKERADSKQEESKNTPEKVNASYLENKLNRIEAMTGPELLLVGDEEFEDLNSAGQKFFGNSQKNPDARVRFFNRLQMQRSVAEKLRTQQKEKLNKIVQEETPNTGTGKVTASTKENPQEKNKKVSEAEPLDKVEVTDEKILPGDVIEGVHKGRAARLIVKQAEGSAHHLVEFVEDLDEEPIEGKFSTKRTIRSYYITNEALSGLKAGRVSLDKVVSTSQRTFDKKEEREKYGSVPKAADTTDASNIRQPESLQENDNNLVTQKGAQDSAENVLRTLDEKNNFKSVNALEDQAGQILEDSNFVDGVADELIPKGKEVQDLDRTENQQEKNQADFKFDRIQALLRELEPKTPLAEKAKEFLNKYNKLGFKTKFAIGLAALGAGTLAGGFVGGSIIFSRRAIATSASVFGTYNTINLLRERGFSRKLEKSIKDLEMGPAYEGALGQGLEDKSGYLEKINELLGQAIVRGAYNGKNEAVLRQDANISKLLELWDKTENAGSSPEERLQLWSQNANVKLEKYFVSEGRKRKAAKAAALGIGFLSQYAASAIAEKITEAPSADAPNSAQNPSENFSANKSIDGIKQGEINPDILSPTEKSLEVSSKGVIGTLKDLKGSDPESYAKMMQQLRGIFTLETVGANNSDDSILTRFALEYEKSHFGDLNKISHANIKISPEGLPTLHDVEYMPQPISDTALSESAQGISFPKIETQGSGTLNLNISTPELEVPKPPSVKVVSSATEAFNSDFNPVDDEDVTSKIGLREKHEELVENDIKERPELYQKTGVQKNTNRPGLVRRFLKSIFRI